MKIFNHKSLKISNVKKLRIKSILYIAIFWTLTDFITVLLRDQDKANIAKSLWIRELTIFSVSIIIAYLFIFRLTKILRSYPLWLNFLLKSFILLASAFAINFLIHFFNDVYISNKSAGEAINHIMGYALHKDWLLQKILYWIVIFFITQLFLII